MSHIRMTVENVFSPSYSPDDFLDVSSYRIFNGALNFMRRRLGVVYPVLIPDYSRTGIFDLSYLHKRGYMGSNNIIFIQVCF